MRIEPLSSSTSLASSFQPANEFESVFRRPKTECVEVQISLLSWEIQFSLSSVNGLLLAHHDHWDVASLYERFPVIAKVLKVLRKRIQID